MEMGREIFHFYLASRRDHLAAPTTHAYYGRRRFRAYCIAAKASYRVLLGLGW
jgi:hypothetical protein